MRAQALWLTAPRTCEIRPVSVPPPTTDEVLVRTRFSAVSRGTETLVFHGLVPASQREVMRCPFQEGEFPGPVKYGYLSVGVVERGPDALVGRDVFCLYPHQTRYTVPRHAVLPVPENVPAHRAVLAGTVETAVNALWDGAPRLGDRVAVVGAGMVGCCVARLLARIPGVDIELVDVDPSRAATAEAMGARFAPPDEATRGCDLVVHTSGTGAGLETSLRLLAADREVLELSWYGTAGVQAALGEEFHSRRLGLRASQVGTVAPARSSTRTANDRRALALRLLADPAFDALFSGESAFAELPAVMARIAGPTPPPGGHPSAAPPDVDAAATLCHRIVYPST
ncbi:zinc-dependent alcohol dehydrogenase [Spiractinospora alimapuensis]|uniref:zinc-dependent alcohol dehydrogenase n=1 Tax=Spiractinospora alimapuensis TaxID=2820884 RepID=UPI001F3B33CF|nr:zinc-binding alcohol dehydrogenase [Spiractinospora alimapuensis]